MTVLVLKRRGDKLDAVLAAVVLWLGVLVLGVYLSAPRLTCVPLACVGRPYTALCARDWLYLRYAALAPGPPVGSYKGHPQPHKKGEISTKSKNEEIVHKNNHDQIPNAPKISQKQAK